MSRRKERLNERKREIIQGIFQEYNIENIKDIENALKDLMGDTIEDMLEAEMNDYLGYEKYTREEKDNYRNGYKDKKVVSNLGELTIEVPQDRNSTFEPKIVKKREKDISEISEKIIRLYAIGMSTRDISKQIKEIYGCEISESLVSDITDKILPKIEEWKTRILDEVYPVIYIDAVHFSVKENGIVTKKAVYVVLGINSNGIKDVLGIYIGENESSKYWLTVLNDLKNRGVKDILIVCADGLTGIKEAIKTAYPKAEYQRCIVHLIRNTLKFVSYKDYKELANDLKTIYLANTEEQAKNNLDIVTDKWEAKYPTATKVWYRNWEEITPIFKFSMDVRKIIYTTNAIESLNAQFKKINKNRTVFPNKKSLEKALYLAIEDITKKWTLPIRNWAKVHGELSIMYDGRI